MTDVEARMPGQAPGTRIVAAIGVAIAIGLQLLTTIYLGSTPVRVAVADLVIPFAALAGAAAFFASGARRPLWVTPQLDLMLLGFLLWLGVSCVVGWQRSGAFIAWAWGPKFIGFGVLIAYLFAGALVSEAGAQARERAILAFLSTTWAIALSSLLRFFVEINGALPFGEIALRPVGFSDNPNAFAFLLGTALLLQLLASPAVSGASRALAALGLAAIVGGLFLIGSRSAYLGLILALPAVVFFHRRLDRRMIIVGIALSPILIFGATQNLDVFRVTTSTAPSISNPLAYAMRDALVVDGGVSERVETTRIAIALWREAPLFGVGVGGFMHHYAQASGGRLFALHTSALWLLAETGIVGLILFAAMFAALFWGIQKRAGRDRDGLSAALCAILLFAAGASIGTEIIYQRHLWFIIGLAAAYPGAWSTAIASFRAGRARTIG